MKNIDQSENMMYILYTTQDDDIICIGIGILEQMPVDIQPIRQVFNNKKIEPQSVCD
jgi:hypothetical protein